MQLLTYFKYTTTFDNRKCIDLFGIGASAGAVGNLVSSIITNNTNKKIAQQNNDLAIKLFNEGNEFNRAEREESQNYNTSERESAQRYNTSERIAAQEYNTKERIAAQDYNTQMWLRQAEYNSAPAQAERLRASGINPSAVLGDAGSVGSVQSSPASVSPASVSPASVSGASSAGIPGLVTPQLEAPRFSVISEMLDAMQKHEDIKGARTDNETRSARNKVEIEKLIAEKENLLQSSKLTKRQRERINYEIAGLKIQNARAEFARQHDQIVESRTQQMFEKQMRAMDDASSESMLRMATQRLQNRLAIAADERDAKRLSSDLSEAVARIKKLGAEKGYIDKQSASEILRQSIMRTDKRMKDIDYQSKDLDWQRKKRAFDTLVRDDKDQFWDSFLYYLGDVAGIPVRGLIK